MNVRLKFGIFILPVVAAFPVQGGSVKVSLTISTPSLTVPSGSEVDLTLKLQNISGDVLPVLKGIGMEQGDYFYTIEVLDEKGAPAPDTAYGREGKLPDDSDHVKVKTGSGILMDLKPGDSLEDTSVLTRLHDITVPGKYTIRASRQLPQELGGGKVTSNTIAIIVEAARWH